MQSEKNNKSTEASVVSTDSVQDAADASQTAEEVPDNIAPATNTAEDSAQTGQVTNDNTNDADAAVDAVAESEIEQSDDFAAITNDPEELQQLLERERERVTELEDKVSRIAAEMQNMSRRNEKKLEDAYKFSAERFVMELAPVMDSFDQGMTTGWKQDNIQSLLNGMQQIQQQLLAAMQKCGVERLDPVGEKFDPMHHQAVKKEVNEEKSAGEVLSVFQCGYLLNGRLVRPAMVVVADDPNNEDGAG